MKECIPFSVFCAWIFCCRLTMIQI